MIEYESVLKLVKTSYSSDDVVILLKDLTGKMEELSTEQREQAIQSGIHYSSMLPKEDAPSKEYTELFEKALNTKKEEIAKGIAVVAEKMKREASGDPFIIISLVRAGIPVGILIKRYLKMKYGIDCKHYGISIIRDIGIDINAMNYIYCKETVSNCEHIPVKNYFFVDGWTGKGAIKNQLTEAVEELKVISSKWDDLRDDLYVLADPANITKFCGTHKDFLLPSSCLNSTVSGLVSRSILNGQVNVMAGDFHGAVYFDKFEGIDKSNYFIDTITSAMNIDETIIKVEEQSLTGETGMETVMRICKDFDIPDYKKVKPGIGETTRVLLRRVPWKVLINTSFNDPDIQHILMLCQDKGVPCIKYDLGKHYKVCGIIKELSADA